MAFGAPKEHAQGVDIKLLPKVLDPQLINQGFTIRYQIILWEHERSRSLPQIYGPTIIRGSGPCDGQE